MELLIRVVGKPKSGNIEVDCLRTEAGDVITFKPDGHVWGKEELINPEWRIVRVAGLSETEAVSLVTQELPTQLGQNRLLRKRQMRVDLASLGITAGPRLPGLISVSRNAFRNAMSTKELLADPRVIG
jgi:hypothetical protein